MADQTGLVQILADRKEQFVLLVFSGVAGAFLRAVLAPEEQWKRRVGQGVAGALSAIFLGGLLGHAIDDVAGAGIYSYLAAGFLMGTSGELGMKAVQNKLLVKK